MNDLATTETAAPVAGVTLGDVREFVIREAVGAAVWESVAPRYRARDREILGSLMVLLDRIAGDPIILARLRALKQGGG